jgi:hypothetical protein
MRTEEDVEVVFGDSEVLKINMLVVEDFIIERRLERCSRVGDVAEFGEREKFATIFLKDND